MSNLIQVQNARKSYGARVLFDGATFAVNAGEHVGVIGPNGAGKTTLFKVLIGQEELDSGQVVRSRSLRVGYLRQEDEWTLDQSLAEYLEENCTLPIWDLRKLGLELGLSEAQFAMPIRELSGGYRMRSQLLYIIGCEPNLMMLDEPTNYLDLESLLILERFLIDFNGAFLLISHDRQFLKNVTDHIVEVEAGDIEKFPGNLDDYFEQKALLREIEEKQILSMEAKRKRIQDFVDRFRAKATKARQAQSKLKQLQKMEVGTLKALPVSATIRIPKPIRTGKLVMEVKEASIGYSATPVLSNVTMQLDRGDHVGVVGVNGAGKSTLLKAIAGDLELMGGSISWGQNARIAYFAQHVTEYLRMDDTVFDALSRDVGPEITPQDIRDMAGSLMFSGDDIEKEVSVLSGGEKTRVALGKILLQRAPVLILDEPTNHLDFATVEALTLALKEYEGSIVVVSHDRTFIGRIATKILEIDSGRVSLYPGNYEEYLWSVQKGSMGAKGGQNSSQTAETGSKIGTKFNAESEDSHGSNNEKPKYNYKERRKSLERSIRVSGREAEKFEERLKKFQGRMEEIAGLMESAAGQDAVNLAMEAQELQKSIDLDEYRWLELVEEREGYEKELAKLVAEG